MELNKKNKSLLILLLILAIASFFRLWQLSSIPPGLYSDVAMNGNDALDTLKTGNFKPFYPSNFGREGMMMWLTAASFSIFGASIWAIRIVAAIMGILTVGGLYLLTKEILQNTKYKIQDTKIIALLSTFFLAVSFWHTNFSRLGFRAILLPFVLVFGFYFLFKGFRTQKILQFISAGIFFGLGFYTYTTYRFIIFLFPLGVLGWFLIYREGKNIKKFFWLIAICLVIAFIVALPLGIYFIKNPLDFIGRAAPVSVFSQKTPIKILGESLILHLGMFNIYGDPNWRHNFAKLPMLNMLVGILFLIGTIVSIKELTSSIKNKNYPAITVYCLMLSWFFIMLWPGILTYEGIPHSLRVIGVIPAVFIFSGIGGWKIYEFLNKNIDSETRIKKILIFVSFLFLVAIGFSEFQKYFVFWAKRPEVAEASAKNLTDIGNYLNSLPQEIKKYVIVNDPGSPIQGLSIPAQTPIFVERAKFGETQTTYLQFEELGKIKIGQNKTIIVPLGDGAIFDALSKKFPLGNAKEVGTVKFFEIP